MLPRHTTGVASMQPGIATFQRSCGSAGSSLPSVARFLPFTALEALFPDESGVALAVFLGYVVTACVAAGVRLTRWDV